MHPIFKTKASRAAYLGVWAVVAGSLASLIRLPGELHWGEALIVSSVLCLFYAFVCLTPWYMCRALPLGSSNAILPQHLGAATLACALWIGLAKVLAYTLELGARLNPAIPYLIVIGLLFYMLSVALHYVVVAMEASRESALLARDAELRALKSQINPHFLFNCLNSISALTSTDPARAREMCVRLSDFLRNTLGLGEKSSIAWREELELARTYLEVERVRFGARLQVEMDIDEACSECQAPPLVLQPLIENAIKHGIATLVEGGIVRLESHVRDGNLEVLVENGFDPEAPAVRRHGLGLRNVRSRLQTRFGESAYLKVETNAQTFRAEMVFPCQRVN